MAAEIHFDRGREPAEAIAVGFFNKISSLGEVVLDGDVLQRLVRQPFGKRDDRRGVASEDTGGEGIHLVDGEFHALV